jgi:hypothetical protein
MATAFHEQLEQLAAAMGPATAFQDQLQHLVKAFEPARALQRRFVELSRAFGDGGNGDTPPEGDSPRPRSLSSRERG